jgi:hypothetical protein
MVRSPVERSPLRDKPDRKTASTAGADLPFSSLKSWSVGIHSLSSILYSLVGDVLLVVIQNVMSSLFNSHLFDFHEGWMYVLGVGVAGGMVMKAELGSTL